MKLAKGMITAALVVSAANLTVLAGPADAVTRYSNCKKLNAVYRHGVGMPGAKDKTTGRPVTNFKRDAAVYKANKGRDGDKDGIACEKR
jgi:tetrahydromethanopterin S-methyltransferase subunit D